MLYYAMDVHMYIAYAKVKHQLFVSMAHIRNRTGIRAGVVEEKDSNGHVRCHCLSIWMTVWCFGI